MRNVKEQSHTHHYVPRWYQKRFLTPGNTKFFFLDLHPETVVQDGVAHQRKSLLNWGPARCFYKDDLYTVKLGSWTTDEIEREFFGEVDRRGRAAVEHFAEFEEIAEPTLDASRDLVPYMDAQKFRTPRGLDRLKKRAGNSDQNKTLVQMQRNFEFSTMWMEGVWEIVRARRSPTKFIVTDDPVTFYNRSAFPSEWVYPDDIGLKGIGSRTLFPLGLDSCLIITHLQLTRNLRSIPTEPRTNARSFQSAVKYLGDIEFGRELEEDEVLRINYILKKRATRYIAAAEKDWLYPENHVSTTEWAKLDDDWFLLPHLWKVPFTAEIVMGYEDGAVWAVDEYGRHPGNPGFKDKKQHEKEWVTKGLAKQEWARRRMGKSTARTDERFGKDVGDRLMLRFLREEGLLPPSEEGPK